MSSLRVLKITSASWDAIPRSHCGTTQNSTYQPWGQSTIRGYFKKEIMKEAHLKSSPNGTKVR